MKKLSEITESLKFEDLIQDYIKKYNLVPIDNQIFYQIIKKGNTYNILHIWKLIGKVTTITSENYFFFVQNPNTKNYMFHYEYVNKFKVLRNKLILLTQEELNALF